jgi:hypothetical protein
VKLKPKETELNHLRQKQGKKPVELCWTGAGHWLKTIERDYKSVGGIFVSNDEFIGFLQGLAFEE